PNAQRRSTPRPLSLQAVPIDQPVRGNGPGAEQSGPGVWSEVHVLDALMDGRDIVERIEKNPRRIRVHRFHRGPPQGPRLIARVGRDGAIHEALELGIVVAAEIRAAKPGTSPALPGPRAG